MSRSSTHEDDKVREILERFGEPFDEATSWRVQGTAVIRHATLERMAIQAGIKYGPPTVVRAERDECVLLVNAWTIDGDGQLLDEVWTFGEALIGVNYRVTGRQAAYVYAIAEKRAKDRCILKLIGITDEALDETSAREREADERYDERYAREEETRRNTRADHRDDRRSNGNGHRLPQTPDDAIDALPADRQNKARLYAALNKISGREVDLWEQNRSVRLMLGALNGVDRLDIDRFIEERREL